MHHRFDCRIFGFQRGILILNPDKSNDRKYNSHHRNTSEHRHQISETITVNDAGTLEETVQVEETFQVERSIPVEKSVQVEKNVLAEKDVSVKEKSGSVKTKKDRGDRNKLMPVFACTQQWSPSLLFRSSSKPLPDRVL